MDTFFDAEDVLAAVILSSYIPGVTGPASIHDEKNSAVRRSFQRILQHAIVKHGVTNEVINVKNDLNLIKETVSEGTPSVEKISQSDDLGLSTMGVYWDGGVCNMWPFVDKRTVFVTPVNGVFSPQPSIAPLTTNAKKDGLTLKVTDEVRVGINGDNLESFFRMIISSSDDLIEGYFKKGYDDARRFLEDKNLLQKISVTVPCNPT